MIKPSTYYSLVCKATGLITEKGSKKAMLRIVKANRGVYFLALTSRPIGAIYQVLPDKTLWGNQSP